MQQPAKRDCSWSQVSHLT